jgi:hypothetical protein
MRSGNVRIVSAPAQSSFPVTIWFRDPGFGTRSTVSFEFTAGEPILIVFPSTPGNGALQVNDNACTGWWSISSKIETDVRLQFDEASCRVDVVGTHPVGAVHTDPPTEPKIRPTSDVH